MADPKQPMFFLVQREGVYGRGIVGIFTELPKAEQAARAAAADEPDAHHEFACYQLVSNMRLALAFQPTSDRDDTVWVLAGRLNQSGGYDWLLTKPELAPPDL